MADKQRYYCSFMIIALLAGVAFFRSNDYDSNSDETQDRQTIATEATDSKTIKTAAPVAGKVYASGEPIGIYIKTRGVLVLGTQQVKSSDNQITSPSKHKLKSGDYILEMNGKEISSKKELQSLLQKNGDQEIVLTILRNGEKIKMKLHPVYSEKNQCYQIGAWIRNDTQGIGTVTYIKENGEFAALGHGINDSDLGVHLDISCGSVYETNIATIMKGKEDNPGELIGSIEYIPENYLGNITSNTDAGIFGTIRKNQSQFKKGDLLETAKASEVKKGKAYLRTSISGKSKDYTIEIEKIMKNKKDSQKSLQIRVTDPDLIALTGGIVQGLSGSPIIQDGKLVGAVTHVLVNDPTRGYGIFIENMLEAAG